MRERKRVYILLADGFEVIEALTPIDVMFRAGVDVVKVAVGGSLEVVSSHALATLHCDTHIEECDFAQCDALILPGGNPGYVNLRSNTDVLDAVRRAYDSGKIVAAICGAPTVLSAAGIARQRSLTCHSTVIEQMGDYRYVGGNVVEDGTLITAAGAGVSVEFALAVAARLVDSDTLSRTRRGMEV